MFLRCPGIAVSITSLLVLTASFSHAQDRWTWPDILKNLQVMPKDWSGKRLSPVMKGFTNALGVRCSYCHVGEEGKPPRHTILPPMPTRTRIAPAIWPAQFAH